MIKFRHAILLLSIASAQLLLAGSGRAATESPAAATDVSRIVVYGASGRVGSRLVKEALGRGHHVTAVSRDPSRITLQDDRLTVVAGEVLDSNSVAEIVSGHDAVIVSVRGSVDKSRKPEKAVQRVAAEVIVDVFREIGPAAPRLLYVGGAGSLEVKPGVTYADSIPGVMRMMMPKSLRQEIAGHVLTLEYLRTVDDVRWTYISPAKKFGPGERSGDYRIGGDQMLMDEKGRNAISMEDFSVAVVDEIENEKFVGERFSVAY